MGQSDEFSGRLGLIFATIGAAIGTGNIWRFPRMVGANGGGSFFIPWLIFLFLWSIPLVIAEFAWVNAVEQVLLVLLGCLQVKLCGWGFGSWISTAIGFYYAIVAGWCMKYFTMGATGGLAQGTDFIAEWNNFLEVRVK